MRIKKISQTTPIQAQVINGYSTSTTDAYSASYINASIPTVRDNYNSSTIDAYSSNFVNNLHTYSTNEIRVGEWLGKPLYRKVIDVGNLPNVATKDTATGLTNIICQNIYGRAYNSGSGNTIPLPYNGTGDGYIVISYNNNNIRVTAGSDRSSWAGYIVVEYTKTTD